MTRKSLTREYHETLGDVYHKKGILAAVGYEIKSTIYSIRTKIADVLDVLESPSYPTFEPSWPEGSVAEYNSKTLGSKIKARQAARIEYLLRHKSERKKGLESIAGPTALVAFLSSIFFFSSNVTGNVINGLNQSSANRVGTALFLIGMLGVMAYLKEK